MRKRTITRALGATTLAITLALTATACSRDDNGSRDAATETSRTEHNDADVTFASEMLQHHAQALSMVDLTLERPLDPEVTELAEQIRAAQAPEIETFSDWLTEWDEEIPETMRDHSNAGHDMGDMGESMEGMDTSMPGMMSAEDMAALEGAPDSEFQTLWLEMMIKHHAGAVEMAEEHTDNGKYQPAIDLAEAIAASQNAELEVMQGLLDS